MGKYFQTKRAVLEPGRKGYSMDDCVAVWSSNFNKIINRYEQTVTAQVII